MIQKPSKMKKAVFKKPKQPFWVEYQFKAIDESTSTSQEMLPVAGNHHTKDHKSTVHYVKSCMVKTVMKPVESSVLDFIATFASRSVQQSHATSSPQQSSHSMIPCNTADALIKSSTVPSKQLQKDPRLSLQYILN